METPENGILISPVIFAILGLCIFILAQFLSLKIRVALSIVGLLLIGLFIYKLKSVENNITSIYVNPENKSIHFTSSNIYLVVSSLNIISFCFWLFATLKITFANIAASDKKIFLACSSILMGTIYLIFIVFGQLVCFVCFPILTIGYFAAVEKYLSKIHSE